jgi:hypothetical protein
MLGQRNRGTRQRRMGIMVCWSVGCKEIGSLGVLSRMPWPDLIQKPLVYVPVSWSSQRVKPRLGKPRGLLAKEKRHHIPRTASRRGWFQNSTMPR